MCLVIQSFGVPGFGAGRKPQLGSTSPSESSRAILCSQPGSGQGCGMADASEPSVQPWGTTRRHRVDSSPLEPFCEQLQTKIDVLLKSYCKEELANNIHTIEPASVPSSEAAWPIIARAKSNALHSKGVCYIIYSDQ